MFFSHVCSSSEDETVKKLFLSERCFTVGGKLDELISFLLNISLFLLSVSGFFTESIFSLLCCL